MSIGPDFFNISVEELLTLLTALQRDHPKCRLQGNPNGTGNISILNESGRSSIGYIDVHGPERRMRVFGQNVKGFVPDH